MHSPAIAVDDTAIDQMTDEACDALASIVQKVIGQKHGDIAGQFFGRSTEHWDLMRGIVSDYLAQEELHQCHT